MEHQKDDLSREEQRAFRSLGETQHQSFGNEERIVGALRERGLIRSSAPRGRRWFVRVAAAAAVLAGTFFVGVQYGKQSSVPVDPALTPAVGERSGPAQQAIEREAVEDPSVLDEYRDEPDRPGNGNVLFAKFRYP